MFKKFCFAFAILISTGTMVPAEIGDDMTTEEKCALLPVLHEQFRGVELTKEQAAFKRKARAWYNNNCTKRAARRSTRGVQ